MNMSIIIFVLIVALLFSLFYIYRNFMVIRSYNIHLFGINLNLVSICLILLGYFENLFNLIISGIVLLILGLALSVLALVKKDG